MRTVALSARTIAAKVCNGVLRAEAVAQAALLRADDYDRVQPQAWICRAAADQVLEQARAVDRRVATGENPPLAGVPFVVKDNIDVAGLPTTAACPAFAYTPTRSAAVVEALLAAGAVLLGKVNLDQFATGLSGARSPYGVPHCVFNQAFVSGGSSSGSAVLVAAGVATFALGTDTAGSGRVPAAINGLVGLKPTRGRWSNRGVVPACRSLDCVSVFTRTLDEARLVDQVLARFDADDPWSRPVPAALAATRSPARLGVPTPDALDFSGDEESRQLFAAGVARLRACGVDCVEVDIAPLLEVAQLLYGGPWLAERLDATEALLRSQPAAFHPVVRGLLQEARLLSGAEVFRGLHRLQAMQRRASALWEQIDVLCLPTAPTIFRIAEMLADPVQLNSILGRYTNFVNLLDLSALALPAGFRSNATGFGLTLMAPAWGEDTLFALGAACEQRSDFAWPELDLAGRAESVALAVVGAHLQGMPLHWQLSSRAAEFVASAHTAPVYRLYAMAGVQPAKPALVHVGAGTGAAIAVELYRLTPAAFGSFVDQVPAPLAIGTLSLADGRSVKGFVAEPRALEGAEDITRFGGWHSYVEWLRGPAEDA